MLHSGIKVKYQFSRKQRERFPLNFSHMQKQWTQIIFFTLNHSKLNWFRTMDLQPELNHKTLFFSKVTPTFCQLVVLIFPKRIAMFILLQNRHLHYTGSMDSSYGLRHRLYLYSEKINYLKCLF
jgi:hypothetical protein